MKIKPVLKGLLTFVPGLSVILEKGTGGTDSALYCYEVWLKHLTMLWENGMRTIPNTIAELGPGDSLGIGLAAMLSGVDNYYALDVVKHFNTDTNVKIFDELVDLFETRAGRPQRGWPDYDMYLDERFFPSHILTSTVLKTALDEERIKKIRNALANPESENGEISIKYMIPWSDDSVIKRESVDVVLSHSVLEHVRDLESTYKALSLWLKPGGMMSHQIDFSSHNLSEKWNGHRAYSELLWKIMSGKRAFFINRQPYSIHSRLVLENGFGILCNLKKHRKDGIPRSRLSPLWKDLSEDDLTCAGAFIQSQKL